MTFWAWVVTIAILSLFAIAFKALVKFLDHLGENK
jgi:hypothetical protein